MKNSKRLILTFHKYQREERSYVDKTISLYLKDSNMEHFAHQFSYCIHEMAMNACKANTKRVFFNNEGLTIHDPSHYTSGMKEFKKKTLSNLASYNRLKKEQKIHVEFQIKKSKDRLSVSVINNFPLTAEEQLRIKKRLCMASRYNSVAEALIEAEDSTEGAGLGIVSMLIMLREMGVPETSFQIFSHNDKTHATISLCC